MAERQPNNAGALALAAFIFSTVGLFGCSEKQAPPAALHDSTDTATASPASSKFSHNDAVVWAVNIGGPEHLGSDAVRYLADTLDWQADSGTIDNILGTQDETIFQTYRSGDLRLRQPLANGAYDITFKFAEPEQIAVGERVFSISAEGKTVIADLDVKLARDGNHRAALVRTVTDVQVNDGLLDLGFAASAGEPLLNAIIVRRKTNDSRNWQLLWSDEFDYQGAPDPQRWSFDEWPARKVNDEDQTYTSRARNVRVEDGKLVIEAHKEQYNNAEYTSGRIHSHGKGDFLYGRADIRAKLPAGQGTWSAIWMLPSDPFRYATNCAGGADWQGSSTCDAWPNSGEIDIMEHVGYDMQTVHGTVHNKAYYFVNYKQRKASVEGKTVDSEFHVYSIEWTPEHIYILFDGTPYFYYRNEGTGWQAWPYDHPYHIILNLAIGGHWGRAGGPIDDTLFPVRMEVDYVRVFKPAVN